MLQLPDGGYIVSGCYGWGLRIYALRTDSLGSLLWSHRYPSGYATNMGSYSIATLTEGYIIVGYKDSTNIPANLCLLRTDDSGNTLWEKFYGGDSLDRGYWIEITPDTNFIV